MAVRVCVRSYRDRGWSPRTSNPKKINRLQIQNLFCLRFLDEATNVVLVGGVGWENHTGSPPWAFAPARLKPLLFDDEEPQAAEAARPSIVAPAEVSPSAQDKARRKRTASGEPVHSFRTLLDDLATVANNRVVAPLADAKPFDLITRPTALQRKAFKLLGVRLERTQ